VTTRRTFITLLGGAVAWPLAAQAQQPAKLPTIGFLGASTPMVMGQWTAAFVSRLRELGWIDGRTTTIEVRWAEGRSERYTEIATEFVRLKVDVIVTSSAAPVIAAKQATSKILSSSRRQWTLSAASSSPHWRARVVTSPACRFNRPMLLANDWNSCESSYRV
jgi:hypothetical protein